MTPGELFGVSLRITDAAVFVFVCAVVARMITELIDIIWIVCKRMKNGGTL